MNHEKKIGVNIAVSDRFAKLFQERKAEAVSAVEKAAFDAFMKAAKENNIDPNLYDFELVSCLPSEDGGHWDITMKFSPRDDKELYR